MIEKILAIITEVTGQPQLTLQTDLVRDLQLNSFDVVNIIIAFENEFGIEIETREIRHIQKIKDIADYLEKLGLHD
ncbi:acyl carrier protein [Holdemania massiliensis]|uniref:Acyl carrier protein n=1 Tax=Holdemania massiliensis TaxID=1468449 RepID=A0A6N7SA70_9FIRM|nr:acyl carrier protein [Holdemania massiliensis]MSA72249.1 acyl carrier protein [Holdemania massiliensis]MSA90525.1 acyl carrier protein [Holdemania massiliensis]MSB79331.1 acyl carrier protein [Holdemania massiliensis]MSC34255.1 acyl carrier protein [Holdemania massiliensis]MSC40645.1 acyl carrier protein [Holdemania massiliensis]